MFRTNTDQNQFCCGMAVWCPFACCFCCCTVSLQAVTVTVYCATIAWSVCFEAQIRPHKWSWKLGAHYLLLKSGIQFLSTSRTFTPAPTNSLIPKHGKDSVTVNTVYVRQEFVGHFFTNNTLNILLLLILAYLSLPQCEEVDSIW